MRPLTSIGISFIASAALTATVMTAAPAAAATRLNARLTGAAETKKGDPNGSGTAAVTVDSDKDQICYTLHVKGIAKATAAHIHKGAAGADGSPVVMLTAPASGSSHGCVAVKSDVAKDIVAHPADYYVNVHDAAYPGGAIRGQLGK